MDTNEVDRILVDACLVAKNAWLNGLATEIGQLRGHYQELAEREKALTDALEWYVREDDCTNSGYCAEAKERAEAALALHKEDA